MKNANVKFNQVMASAKEGTLTVKAVEEMFLISDQLSEKQLDWLADEYTRLKTGEKRVKSQDILDSRMLYSGSYGSNSK